jgi:hypothetical protein
MINPFRKQAIRVYKFLDERFGLKTLKEKRLKISTLDDLNDPFELLPFVVADKSHRTALNEARREWGRTTGILCFSADWRDPVVWAHYSDKHRGLCLGFDIPEDTGTAVRYVGGRPSIPQHLRAEDATAWIFTKYDKWAYEKEIRCCVSLDEAVDRLYFLGFGESLKLVEVISGARCKLSAETILEAVRPFSGVSMIKARPGFHRFEIVEDKRGFA